MAQTGSNDARYNGQKKKRQNYNYQQIDFDFCCLMPLSAIFQLYHGDQF
jgi:hypothetical protein